MIQRRKRTARGGFTLLEMMVVVAILVILVGAGTVRAENYSGAQLPVAGRQLRTAFRVSRQLRLEFALAIVVHHDRFPRWRPLQVLLRHTEGVGSLGNRLRIVGHGSLVGLLPFLHGGEERSETRASGRRL